MGVNRKLKAVKYARYALLKDLMPNLDIDYLHSTVTFKHFKELKDALDNLQKKTDKAKNIVIHRWKSSILDNPRPEGMDYPLVSWIYSQSNSKDVQKIIKDADIEYACIASKIKSVFEETPISEQTVIYTLETFGSIENLFNFVEKCSSYLRIEPYFYGTPYKYEKNLFTIVEGLKNRGIDIKYLLQIFDNKLKIKSRRTRNKYDTGITIDDVLNLQKNGIDIKEFSKYSTLEITVPEYLRLSKFNIDYEDAKAALMGKKRTLLTRSIDNLTFFAKHYDKETAVYAVKHNINPSVKCLSGIFGKAGCKHCQKKDACEKTNNICLNCTVRDKCPADLGDINLESDNCLKQSIKFATLRRKF